MATSNRGMVSRLLRAVGALIALLAILVAAPIALIKLARVDLLWTTDWSSALRVADDGRLVTLALSLIAWVAWLVVVASFVAELVSTISHGRIRIRVPLGGLLQPLMAVLIAALIGLASASPPVDVASRGTPSPDKPTTQISAGAIVAEDSSVSHRVEAGDDLWTLAETYYGDGSKWRDVVAANPQIDKNETLRPGMMLKLPGATNPANPKPVPAPTIAPEESSPKTTKTVIKTITVKKGDSLWLLAEQYLGDGERWPEIHALNKVMISDPDEIDIGWKIKIPVVEQVKPTKTEPTQPKTKPAELEPNQRADLPLRTQPVEQSVAQLAEVENPVRELLREPTGDSDHQPADEPEQTESTPASDPAREILGSMAAVLAGAIATGLVARRQAQLSQRAAGRRIIHPSAASSRLRAALHVRAGDTEPPADPGPTTVIVGERADRETVLLDLEAARLTAIKATPDVAADLVGGMVTSLLCAPWSAEQAAVTVIGEELSWVAAFDQPLLSVITDVELGVEQLLEIAEHRRAAASQSEDEEPLEPEVFLFGASIEAEHERAICDAVTTSPGLVVVIVADEKPLPFDPVTAQLATVLTADAQRAKLSGLDGWFVPQLIGEPVRRALIELHKATASTETTKAYWWSENKDEPPTPLKSVPIVQPRAVQPLAAKAEALPDTQRPPQLRLLGPIDLVGATGELPSRAVGQCLEYCAWILLHPGRTSQAMTQSLLVAETTRRSNVSRLRKWLGSSPDGAPYLPDAYTGRITLHPEVTSDWEALQLLVAGGVNRTPSQTLAEALDLVRGAPLADAAPGQWHWAEEWRSDVVSMIRDIALVLSGRALEAGDVETARWATARGLVAAGGDELLLGARIRAEHQAGNKAEVERISMQLTRHARQTGVDLLPETVLLLQQVFEGRSRSRRA